MTMEALVEDLIFSPNPTNVNGTHVVISQSKQLACVIKISTGQVQLRRLHGTSIWYFRIIYGILRGNNSCWIEVI